MVDPNVKPEDVTGILRNSPGTSESNSMPGCGCVTHAGMSSTQMVDLYSLPKGELVNEINRLMILLNNSENEVIFQYSRLNELEREIETLNQIIEAGQRANEKQKKEVEQLKQMINIYQRWSMAYQELTSYWTDLLEETEGGMDRT